MKKTTRSSSSSASSKNNNNATTNQTGPAVNHPPAIAHKRASSKPSKESTTATKTAQHHHPVTIPSPSPSSSITTTSSTGAIPLSQAALLFRKSGTLLNQQQQPQQQQQQIKRRSSSSTTSNTTSTVTTTIAAAASTTDEKKHKFPSKKRRRPNDISDASSADYSHHHQHQHQHQHHQQHQQQSSSDYNDYSNAPTSGYHPSSSAGGNTEQQDLVAKHYNRRPERGIEARKESRIFQLKQFNNWVKSVLIRQYVKPGNTVFDLCCGKGGDLLKFHNAHIKSYVGADIAEESVKAASERYNSSQHQVQAEKRFKFDATFVHANCIKSNLGSTLDDRQFDCVSCQFALHYSFESEDYARTLLVNATSSLKVGGHFIVTCPDAYVLVKKLRAQPEQSLTIGNDVYRAVFHSKHFDASRPYGNRYEFYLSDAIDECPEYLVPPNTLIELAKEYGLQLLLSKNFHEFWEIHSERDELRHLTEKVYKLKSGDMTPEEWEAIYLYRVFVFKKVPEEDEEATQDQDENDDATTDHNQSQQEPVIIPDARNSRFKQVQQSDIIHVA